MADFTQKGKPMRFETPLGPDALLIEKFECAEAVSTPYTMSLDLLSQDASIDSRKLLRKPVVVSVDLSAGGQRHFHGWVRRFVQLGRSEGLVSYRAEVVPSMWFLSLASDCRIFQQKHVPDIVKAVLNDAGVTDVRLALTGSYPARDYCVQYRESHLAFISRLMEEEGIFYFFEHTKEKHTMVLADAPSAVKAGSVAKLSMLSVAGAPLTENIVSDLSVDTEVRSTGKVTLVDYNDSTAKRLEGSAKGRNIAGAAQLSQFDYPGKFQAVPDGERLARVRIEEAESLSYVVDGRTTCRAVGSGQKLDITDHYRRDVNASYHILSARHMATDGSYRSDDGADAFSFESAFQGIPHAVPYRPQRLTPRAVVYGTQTAVVVGPSGSEIYVDKFSRVKVQFYWDQAGKNDDKSSCWVRVSSTWAGKQWGVVQIPRIGQEVVVDFLEGDPDRPMIVGRVYNGEQMPPYDLPTNSTQSGIKTRSSKAGAAADANEIRFEDKKGEEHLLIHAQKDQMVEVENDETHTVDHDRVFTIGNDDTITVKHDRKETVENDETITIKHDRTETVENDETVTIKGKQVFKVTKDRTLTVEKGNDTLTMEKGNLTTAVKMGNVETKVDMGNVTLKAALGKIEEEAMQGIELKVGSNSIKIDQTGVTIKGLMVKVEGTTMTEVKGLMTTVKADAMMTVKGAITMIN